MRIAVLGLGFMGATHLKALYKIPGISLTAVSSADPKTLTGDLSGVGGNLADASAVYDFSDVAKYADALEAARSAPADAVDLCLPTALHAETAIAALRAGKHVLVEKPMALSGEEAEAMMAAARESGRILMCAQVLRFFPAYLPLIDAVRESRFGEVRHAFFRRRCAAPGWSAWLASKKVSGGGVFDLLIHDIDMMLYLFGLPTHLRAWGHEDLERGIDLLTAQFDFPSGLSATVTGGWHLPKAYPFSMEYTVIGDQGAMEYSSAGREPHWYDASGGDQLLTLPETDGYQAEIEYFVACCAEGRSPDRCTPESSAAAVRIARLAEESRTHQGELISCQ